MGSINTPCPGCGRHPGPALVLAGWYLCGCGGHRTSLCRIDRGGCGTEQIYPPLDPKTCPDPPGSVSSGRIRLTP